MIPTVQAMYMCQATLDAMGLEDVRPENVIMNVFSTNVAVTVEPWVHEGHAIVEMTNGDMAVMRIGAEKSLTADLQSDMRPFMRAGQERDGDTT